MAGEKQKKTLAQQARDLGISVSTLKERMKREQEASLIRKAKSDLMERSAGWDPRSGNRKRVK